MSVKELFAKHGRSMLKNKDFLNIFDNFEMLKHYAVFPISDKNEMYTITAKKSAAFPADSNQKYRHIISRLNDQITLMPKELLTVLNLSEMVQVLISILTVEN